MGFEQETYIGFLEADYYSLLSVDSSTLNDYLNTHFHAVTGGDGSTYYIFEGDQYVFLDLLEDAGIEAESYEFALFTYIKSTWSFYGF